MNTNKMKKMMITAAIVCAATMANAVNVDWSLAKDSAKTYGGKTIYVIDGADFATVDALLKVGGKDVSTAFDSYVVCTATANSRGSASGQAIVPSTCESLALFIFTDVSTDPDVNIIGNGFHYDTTGAISVEGLTYTGWTSPGELSLSVDSFTSTGNVIGSGLSGAVNAPEPTSGLLMLLGVAGLALKRKRA